MTGALNVIYFPAAVALGALHALEPGHAKALTAAYLIGIKGTKKDSVVLGLSVATTHSIIVIAISSIGLWLGQEAFAGTATHWLEMASGFVAIGIGSWMLWRRLFLRTKAHDHGHSHPPMEPVSIQGKMLKGEIEIIESPLGERMRFHSFIPFSSQELAVVIDRKNGLKENLILLQSPDNETMYLSTATPKEPHEFVARIEYIQEAHRTESIEFSLKEPEEHYHHEHHSNSHGHDHLDDVAHAKAHKATLPEYVQKGERPTLGQIALFGAAGGMIPCPASITVMLLALSTGRAGLGVLTVLGFSLGLALALVGIGVIVVSGLSKLSHTGRFSSLSRRAPVISAALVIVSGIFALVVAH